MLPKAERLSESIPYEANDSFRSRCPAGSFNSSDALLISQFSV
ncbi:MAG: hypothetical protein R3A12_08370 [Ignavibacteria bacterium]